MTIKLALLFVFVSVAVNAQAPAKKKAAAESPPARAARVHKAAIVVDTHIDTTSGEMEMAEGHIEGAEVKLTVPYSVAKAIFVDNNPQAGMQAFMSGQIKVEGDMTKLMAMQGGAPDATATEMAGKIAEITE